MKNLLRLLLFLCVLNTQSLVGNAAAYYNEYTNVSSIKDTVGCASMQGMTAGNSSYVYCIKTGTNRAALVRSSKNGGGVVTMKNAATNNYTCDYLGHANDMTFLEAGTKDYLYVVTKKDKNYSLIKLEISGTTYKKVGQFNFKLGSKYKDISGIDIMSSTSSKVTFLLKSGMTFFKATVSKKSNSGNVSITEAFKIDVKNAKVNGKTVSNISTFSHQGFDYSDGRIYVPLTKGNVSIVLTYDGAKTAMKGSTLKASTTSFRITSKKYAALFEIESCKIIDKKLYFCYNARVTNSDCNHDAIAYFKGFTVK